MKNNIRGLPKPSTGRPRGIPNKEFKHLREKMRKAWTENYNNDFEDEIVKLWEEMKSPTQKLNYLKTFKDFFARPTADDKRKDTYTPISPKAVPEASEDLPETPKGLDIDLGEPKPPTE